eukprot:5583808-Alexandrium_andersonii.AAC.1
MLLQRIGPRRRLSPCLLCAGACVPVAFLRASALALHTHATRVYVSVFAARRSRAKMLEAPPWGALPMSSGSFSARRCRCRRLRARRQGNPTWHVVTSALAPPPQIVGGQADVRKPCSKCAA